MAENDTGVTLIIPTLNELKGMQEIMPKIKKEWYDELLIVDGGSTDGTIEYCHENNYPIFVQSGRGLPNAETEALHRSTRGIIVIFTPDGNSIPELIPVLTTKLKQGFDMVIASRYLGSAKSYDDDFLTGLGNKLFTKMIRVLFRANYTDTLVGLRAYKRDAILLMRLDKQEGENLLRKNFFYMNSWEVGSCLRAAKLKLKVAEIPGDEPLRIGGIRKLSIIKNGTGVLLQILYELIIGLRFNK